MNDKEFEQVLATRRYLALVLVRESAKAYRNEPNELTRAVETYYDYEHDLLFDADADNYCFFSISDGMELFKKNESRLKALQEKRDAVDEFAAKIFTLVDNGDIRL